MVALPKESEPNLRIMVALLAVKLQGVLPKILLPFAANIKVVGGDGFDYFGQIFRGYATVIVRHQASASLGEPNFGRFPFCAFFVDMDVNRFLLVVHPEENVIAAYLQNVRHFRPLRIART